MKNLYTFKEFLNENINESDMTKFYDGFILYDMKKEKEYKSRYIKSVKNNVLEAEIIKKIAKETGSNPASIAVHRFIKKGEWNKSELEVEEVK